MKLIFSISYEEALKLDPNIRKNKKNYWIIFENPIEKICLEESFDVLMTVREIQNFFDKWKSYNKYFAGFFSYDLGFYLLNLINNNNKYLLKLPLIFGGFFDSYRISEDLGLISKNIYLNNFKLLETYKNYQDKIIKIRDYIHKGNVYQINYAFPVQFSTYGEPLNLFYALWNKQKSWNASFIQNDDFFIICASPEMFFYCEDNQTTLKPMKGTSKKYPSLRKNIQAVQYLKNSKKELAENAMIVDLIRNDLGRISKIGTVKIDHLFKIEIYETIIQMISQISSTLRVPPNDKNFWEALFPSGSVTGAPKISSIKYIQELETYRRGIYTGSIGWKINKYSKFNVAIRTIIGSNLNSYYYVGSGITYDSLPRKEFKECMNKIKFLKEAQKELKPDYIFTTMKFSGGIIYYEKSHLKRLKETKMFFQYPIKENKIIKKFIKIKKYLLHLKYPIRIHFRVYKNGKIYVHLSKLNYKKNYRIGISNIKTDYNNIFLYYKTSNREIYQSEFEKYKNHFDEVIFLNKDGYITEGSFTNIIIKKNGLFYTPSIAAGLLDGILRKKIIKKWKIQEKNINLEELKNADQIFLVNSVRGIIKAQME